MSQLPEQLQSYITEATQEQHRFSVRQRLAIVAASVCGVAGIGLAASGNISLSASDAAVSTDFDATAALSCAENGNVLGSVTAYKHYENGVFSNEAGTTLGSIGAEKSQTSNTIDLGKLSAGSNVLVIFNEVPITNVTESLKHMYKLVVPDCDEKEVTTTAVKPDVSTIVPPVSEAPKDTTTTTATTVPKNVSTTAPALPTPATTQTTTPPSTGSTLPSTYDYKVPQPGARLPRSSGNNL